MIKIPDSAKEYAVGFTNLTGGLNLYDPDYKLKRSESPDMKNLLWQDGSLGCRAGQSWVVSESQGVGYACFDALFHGFAFFHIGEKIFCSDLSDGLVEVCDLGDLYDEYEASPGVFFRYRENLYYKAKGVYVEISWDGAEFSAQTTPVYTPVTVINADAGTGAGDIYQPENRLSAEKAVWYNAATKTVYETVTATATTTFTLAAANVVDVVMVTVDGSTRAEGFDYTVSIAGGKATLTFYAALTAGQKIRAELKAEDPHYYLPVTDAELAELTVGGAAVSMLPTDHASYPVTDPAAWDAAWDAYGCVFWPGTGHILLKNAAPVTRPFTNNTVKATYSKANADALNSVMDCDIATVYGASRDACVIFGGCPSQPNAYFWNGSHVVMDAGYFPMEQYNLAGDAQESITGFGRQYNTLIVLKERSVGKTEMDTTEIDGRVRITMDYTPINGAIGCDIPKSIQIIENNIVFANMQGVHRVASSSPAMENNINCISTKINGSAARPGLLSALTGDAVSLDDGKRYWICSGGKVYIWDYELSSSGEPSWFYCTNIYPVGFVRADRLYHLNADGKITVFDRGFSDYGEGIEKVFTFPTQTFGGYDRLKDVTGAIFVLRSDTSSKVEITYKTDYEERRDLTDILALTWALVPRTLAFRYLSVTNFATTARRKPFCRHIRHFTAILKNDDVGADMTLVSAQFFYRYQGRDR